MTEADKMVDPTEESDPMLALHSELVEALRQPFLLENDAVFDDLCRRIHAVQYETILPLKRLALHQGKTPAQTRHWQELPAIPAQAYKRYSLHSAQQKTSRVFQSSGTSSALDGNASAPSVSKAAYSQEGLGLMERVIELNASRMLFPDLSLNVMTGKAEIKAHTLILVLAPPPSAAPGMIMAFGMQHLIHRWGAPGSRFLLGPGGLTLDGIIEMLVDLQGMELPVTLIGASFGFVHLLDRMAALGVSVSLPEGSRTMDAGGFKGRSREVSPAHMRTSIGERLGIPTHHIINLLGMTELPSQLYDDRLAAAYEGRDAQIGKRIPPWMRCRVLDPISMNECATGEPGLLMHVDLANVERPLAVLSDDLGIRHPDGSLEVLGRATGAEARGCSLSLEEWMAGAP